MSSSFAALFPSLTAGVAAPASGFACHPLSARAAPSAHHRHHTPHNRPPDKHSQRMWGHGPPWLPHPSELPKAPAAIPQATPPLLSHTIASRAPPSVAVAEFARRNPCPPAGRSPPLLRGRSRRGVGAHRGAGSRPSREGRGRCRQGRVRQVGDNHLAPVSPFRALPAAARVILRFVYSASPCRSRNWNATASSASPRRSGP